MPSPSAEIEIRFFRLDEPRQLVLSEAEKMEARNISVASRRVRYERTRSALRETLAIRLGIGADALEFLRTPAGKPYLANAPDCEFSLSHSGDWLAVAAGAAPLGIDLETRIPHADVTTLATRFFSSADSALLASQRPKNQKAHFIKQWVAKEAALKAAGTGIAYHLHKAECLLANGAIRAVRWEDTRFAIQEFSLSDGTPGALACAQIFTIQWRDTALLAKP